MNWLRDLPIRRKLTLVILATCSVVLLLACGVLAGSQMLDFRRSMVRDNTVLADVLAKNTQAALAFQDENAAAVRFWRHVATKIAGDAWTEDRRPVPGQPSLPPDTWISFDVPA